LAAGHYRQIYLGKLHRLWELEEALGALRHTRFRRDRVPHYPIVGPRGHNLDIAVYALTSVGSAALGAARNGFDPGYLTPLPVVLATAAWVTVNERRHSRLMRATEVP